ncbi:redoxin domain-containing protein [Paenibacillus sp. LMG 31456]|uniref:Redoxin domain-containing protein n=1 Tax=Paenibacillus foliorum TaxID=2654974 RepID=A0A972K309_9BACL|nr:SCO family protein [Paenibacillus foliorum]NOU94432.1 redoxin domain-containing protein [Paenibacillus foliorum]
MNAFLRKNGFKLLVTLLFALFIGSVISWLNQDSPALPVIKQAPTFTLNSLEGEKVQLSDSAGKVRLIEFLFTSCPDVCPMTTYNMVKLQNELKMEGIWGNKVQFLSITFDPLKDTPEVFKKYGDRMGMDYDGWKLLTGTEAETGEVAKSFGVMVQKMPDGSFVHTVTSLFLVDGAGKIRKVFAMGEGMNNEDIIQKIRQIAGSVK